MPPRFPFFRAAAAPSWRASSRMPLRAKILNASMATQAEIHKAVEIPRNLPGDAPDDVLFNTLYGIRTIELNRPNKYNSLNGSMARKIIPRLKEWEKSDMANVVVIKGRGPKAFCAGGDVAALVGLNRQGSEGKEEATRFFGLEYQLDHLIATYRKPYIAFMDGITMGGGVGLSVHAPFRIATERTDFAMPETGIGFFPDVGGSFFLPRLDGKLGTYLGLTGDRLTGVDVFYTGIATHYLHSSSLPDLESRLAELYFNDYDTLEDRWQLVDSTIEEFASTLPHDRPMLISGSLRAAIDRVFTPPMITGIVRALEKEIEQASHNDKDEAVRAWAEKTLQTLHSRSPTSLRVACRQMQIGTRWSIGETFQREHVLASKLMGQPDFEEGVSAQLIDKPRRTPQWRAIPEDDDRTEMVDEIFNVTGYQRLPLVSTNVDNYRKYPFASITGLPREEDVESIVKDPRPVFNKARVVTKTQAMRMYDSSQLGVAPAVFRAEAEAEAEDGDESDGETNTGNATNTGKSTDKNAAGATAADGSSTSSSNASQGRQQRQEAQASILTRRKVVTYFLRKTDHKWGVEEKVTEILTRKTRVESPTDDSLFFDPGMEDESSIVVSHGDDSHVHVSDLAVETDASVGDHATGDAGSSDRDRDHDGSSSINDSQSGQSENLGPASKRNAKSNRWQRWNRWRCVWVD